MYVSRVWGVRDFAVVLGSVIFVSFGVLLIPLPPPSEAGLPGLGGKKGWWWWWRMVVISTFTNGLKNKSGPAARGKDYRCKIDFKIIKKIRSKLERSAWSHWKQHASPSYRYYQLISILYFLRLVSIFFVNFI